MTDQLPVEVLAAAIALRDAFAAHREPDVWAVMAYSHWAGLHHVGDDWVEEIMSAHMTREPSWYAGLWARPRHGGAPRR